jgi:hypothetical protein
MRSLAPEDDAPSARLDIARRVMRHLPETAWLRRNGYFGDHIEGGDAGLYDLLLNPRDRAYTAPEFLALLEGAGLQATALMEPLRYDPAVYLPDPRLRARVAAMDPAARAGLAEALTGNMSTHVAYCVRAAEARTAPDPMGEDAIPVARETPAVELARNIRGDGTLPFLFDGLRVPLPLPPLAAAILGQIDGVRTVGGIAAALQARGTDAAAFTRAWRQTYDALSSVNRILLAPSP